MPDAPATLDSLQAQLRHRFTQPELLRQALTHRSFGAGHNERLEFLGDAALNLAISALLFQRYGASDEGDLTRVRAHLVREASLHRVALSLGLPALVRMSEAEGRAGGAQRPALLADALEAVLGALQVDGGFAAVQAAVAAMFGELIQGAQASDWQKDAKTALQEWLQARRLPVPEYRIAGTRGRAHEQTFQVDCLVPALKLQASAEGRSRRAAEQQAAQAMLKLLPEGARTP